jgi:hypothetical protein
VASRIVQESKLGESSQVCRPLRSLYFEAYNHRYKLHLAEIRSLTAGVGFQIALGTVAVAHSIVVSYLVDSLPRDIRA